MNIQFSLGAKISVCGSETWIKCHILQVNAFQLIHFSTIEMKKKKWNWIFFILQILLIADYFLRFKSHILGHDISCRLESKGSNWFQNHISHGTSIRVDKMDFIPKPTMLFTVFHTECPWTPVFFCLAIGKWEKNVPISSFFCEDYVQWT